MDKLFDRDWEAVPEDCTDLYTKALELWRAYYRETDAFDETVCSGRRVRVAVPASPAEQALSSRFAREAWIRVDKALTAAEIARHISDAARLAALREA